MGIAINHLPISASHLDLEGRILAVNPAACALAGRAEADLLGKMVFDFEPTLAPLWQGHIAHCRAHGSVTSEIDLITAVGLRTIQFTRSLLVVDGVEIIQSFAIDITALKVAVELEERTAAKQRSE